MREYETVYTICQSPPYVVQETEPTNWERELSDLSQDLSQPLPALP
jgi:hypothetical protein